MRWKSAGFAVAVATFIGHATSSSVAQSWPQRTVRVILPNPPGVGIDVVARLFTERLSQRWARAVIVENIPGADGNLAAREFVANRDDHTLLYSFPGLITINPLTYEKLPYDPTRDLVPIASTSDNFLAIAISQSLKFGSLSELIKARPKLTWASTPGVPHFAFAGLQKHAGLDSTHVPYRDFSQALADLMAGRIDAVASGAAPILPHAKGGKLKVIAMINSGRSPAAPDVPALTELGFAEFSFNAVTGFFGWRDIPAELRDRLAAQIREVAADPAIGAQLSKMGSAALGSTPAEFAAMIEEQRRKVAAIDKLLKSK
jgi:tripartite-type tricarboxylate transporter receptor subunit TctC